MAAAWQYLASQFAGSPGVVAADLMASRAGANRRIVHVADATGAVSETDELNNTTSKAITYPTAMASALYVGIQPTIAAITHSAGAVDLSLKLEPLA